MEPHHPGQDHQQEYFRQWPPYLSQYRQSYRKGQKQRYFKMLLKCFFQTIFTTVWKPVEFPVLKDRWDSTDGTLIVQVCTWSCPRPDNKHHVIPSCFKTTQTDHTWPWPLAQLITCCCREIFSSADRYARSCDKTETVAVSADLWQCCVPSVRSWI